MPDASARPRGACTARVLAAALALGPAACVERPAPVGVAAVDASFTPLTVRWTDSGFGRSIVYARVERRGDDTVVCGALTEEGLARFFADDILDTLRDTELRHGRVRLLRGLHGFAGPRSPDAALCVISPAPWSEAFAGPAALRLGFVRDVIIDIGSDGPVGAVLRAAPRVCPPGLRDC